MSQTTEKAKSKSGIQDLKFMKKAEKVEAKHSAPILNMPELSIFDKIQKMTKEKAIDKQKKFYQNSTDEKEKQQQTRFRF